MTRLIDAEALKTIKSIQSADFNSIETIRQWIDSAPTIDTIIDIVRCEDCKYWDYEAEGDFGIKYGFCEHKKGRVCKLVANMSLKTVCKPLKIQYNIVH